MIAGVDAGGTAVKCVLLNNQGKILARTTAGPANPQLAGFKEAARQIKKAVKKAAALANCSKIDYLGIGLAGAGRAADQKNMKFHLQPFPLVENMVITDDGIIGLFGALAGKCGINVIAGTGSIVYAIDAERKIRRRGGWGPLVGDEGSGFYLGLEAIKSAIRAQEKVIVRTDLLELVKKYFSFHNLEEVIPYIYQQRLPRKEIAALAPAVIKSAANGDLVSEKILDAGLGWLGRQVESLYQTMSQISLKQNNFYEEILLTLSGGLFKNKYYHAKFSNKIKKKVAVKIRQPLYPADLGAAFFVTNHFGINLELKDDL